VQLPAIIEIGPTTAVQAVNFLVLLAVLKYTLYDPLKKVVHERERKVRDDLDEAESINARAKMLKEEYEEKLKAARDEATRQYQKIVSEAERVRNERLKAVEGEVEAIRKKVMAELAQDKEKAALELRRSAGTLAVEIAGKLLKSAMSPDFHKSLVQDFIKKVESGDAAR